MRIPVAVFSAIVLAACACAQTAEPPPPRARMFGLIPNNRTVEPGASVPRLRARDKFRLARMDAFDPVNFIVAGMYAGMGQYFNQNASWGQGAQGYGKRYGAALGDQISGTYFREAIVPSIFRQDPRYYRMGTGGAGSRIWYAISRVAVAPSDSGRPQFNTCEIVGNAAMVGLSYAYYPPEGRTRREMSIRYGSHLGSDALFNVLKEFWPDIKRKFFTRK